MKKTAVSVIALLIFALAVTSSWAGDAFIWPVNGDVVKRFNPDEHRGIDIAANAGDDVLATLDGVVNWIGKTPRGEPCISIDHPNGLTSTYLPVRATVSKGQSVKAGDIIGTLSSEIDKTSDLPHLHFGFFDTSTRGNPFYFDPEDYLPVVAHAVEPSSGDHGSETAAVSVSEGRPELQTAGNPVEEIQDTSKLGEPQASVTPTTIIEEPSSRQVAYRSPQAAPSAAKPAVEVEIAGSGSNAGPVTAAEPNMTISVKPATSIKLINSAQPVGIDPTTSLKQVAGMGEPGSAKPVVGAEAGNQEKVWTIASPYQALASALNAPSVSSKLGAGTDNYAMEGSLPVTSQLPNPSLSNARISKVHGVSYDEDTGKTHVEKEAHNLKLDQSFSIARLVKSKSKKLILTATTLLFAITVIAIVGALLARRVSRARETSRSGETLIIRPSAIGSSFSC